MFYVNLHTHTTFSIFDGMGYPSNFIDFVIDNAKEESMALGFSDHGNCNSFGYLYTKQKDLEKKQIPFKCIYGVEAYYIPSLQDWKIIKEAKKEEKQDNDDDVIEDEKESKRVADPVNRRNHLLIFAYNNEGLKNLYKLVSLSNIEGFYRYPRIDFNLLEKCNKGLGISTACIHPDSTIRTSVGEIKIKELIEKHKKGIEIFVMGYSFDNDKVVFRKVLWGDLTRKKEKLIKIKLKNGKELKLTKDHKVYTNLGWVEAGSLTKNHKILSFGILASMKQLCEFCEIDRIDEIEEVSDVYDIEVQDIHNFFANDILVHNCIGGLPSYLIQKQLQEQKPIEDIYKIFDNELKPLFELFKDRSYLELQFNGLEEQTILNKCLIEYSKQTNYPLIVTSDAHMYDPNLWKHREMYKALGWQRKGGVIDSSVLEMKEEDLKCLLYPHNGNQIFEAYKKYFYKDFKDEQLIKDAIERTYTIAHEHIERVDPYSKPKLPNYNSDNKSLTPFDELKKLTIQALKDKKLDKNKKYIERAIYELKVIKNKEISQYFLVLREAIIELKKELQIGPARGSCAGSLVCYLLDITQIDPIRHGLLFERFISESRKDMPDADIDVSDRDTTIAILQEKFGENSIAYITNYSTLQLKSLVKDLSKLFGVEFQEVNEVTKVMEDEAKDKILAEIGHDQKLYQFTLEKAKQHSPTFKKYIEKHTKLGDYIEKLYGNIRSTSTHAGGTLICNNITEDMPTIKVKGKLQAPWTEGTQARHLEQFGLIKYDFLGLATLRIIKRCIELITNRNGVNEFYDKYLHPDIINPKDEKIFNNVYKLKKFPGIFQFTERGVQNFVSKADPICVEDISNITAIFRPGPLNGKADKKYLDNKDSYINYEHETLKKILGPTKNTLIYQEQFMQLAHELADFTLEESDQLRKLLVKPSHELGEKQKEERIKAREKFISGCIKNGLSQLRSEKLWDEEILGFISYGFNKSHALSYAYISYQCAYLLTYHEKQWIQAYLENDDDRDKAIADVSCLGYKFHKPDINYSTNEWQIKDKDIYFPFINVKGMGLTSSKELLEVRKRNDGLFKDLNDLFYKEEDGKPKWRWSKFNKRNIEQLIQIEAFDSLDCVGFGKLFENYKHMFEVVSNNFNDIKKGKINLKELSDSCEDKRGWNISEKVILQKDLLGTYDKTLLFDRKTLDLFVEYDILPLTHVDEITKLHWFIIDKINEKMTRNNKPYLQLKILDIDGKERSLNYFQKPKEPLKKNIIYVAPMALSSEGFLNIPFGKELVEIGNLNK